MQTALWPLQVALFERLSTTPAVANKVTGVYDDVPEGVRMPYIQLGEPNVTPFDTKTSRGEDIAFVVHVWSDYSGKKETYDILNACLQALSKPLIVSGFFAFAKDRTQMQVFDDIDGSARHGVLRMQFHINNI